GLELRRPVPAEDQMRMAVDEPRDDTPSPRVHPPIGSGRPPRLPSPDDLLALHHESGALDLLPLRIPRIEQPDPLDQRRHRGPLPPAGDRKSTRLNSSHVKI